MTTLLAPFFLGDLKILVLDTVGKLGKILIGMNKALGEIPMTVKLRTGVKDGKNTAHKLMPRLSTEWNVRCITVFCFYFLFFWRCPNIFIWFSSTDEQDNSGTRDSPIGITSSSAYRLSGHKRQMKAVSFVPRFYIFCTAILTIYSSISSTHLWWR